MDIRWRKEAISDKFPFHRNKTSKGPGDLQTVIESKNQKVKKSTKNIKTSSM